METLKHAYMDVIYQTGSFLIKKEPKKSRLVLILDNSKLDFASNPNSPSFLGFKHGFSHSSSLKICTKNYYPKLKKSISALIFSVLYEKR